VVDKISLNKGKGGLIELRGNNKKKGPGSSPDKYYGSKDLVIQKTVLAALKNHPRGILASQLAKELNLHHQQMMSILETLVALREAYDFKYGNTKLFFPNGRLNHPISFQDMKIDNKNYSFCEIVQHLNGQKYIFIQEKELDHNNVLEPKGGILLNEIDLDQFIQKLSEFREKLHQRDDNSGFNIIQ